MKEKPPNNSHFIHFCFTNKIHVLTQWSFFSKIKISNNQFKSDSSIQITSIRNLSILGNHSVVASDGQSIVRLDEVPVPRMRLCFVGEAKKPERFQPKFKPVWQKKVHCPYCTGSNKELSIKRQWDTIISCFMIWDRIILIRFDDKWEAWNPSNNLVKQSWWFFWIQVKTGSCCPASFLLG